MIFVRLLVPLGLVLFGSVAAFMGIVVLATSLRSGEISTGDTRKAGAVVTARRDADPAAYWMKVAALGFAPALLGAGAAVFGWRRLGR